MSEWRIVTLVDVLRGMCRYNTYAGIAYFEALRAPIYRSNSKDSSQEASNHSSLSDIRTS